jgi:hypothetical protein
LIQTSWAFRKPSEFIAGTEPEETPQFRFRDAFVLIFLQRKSLERAAGQIDTGSAEPAGDVVGNVNDYVHLYYFLFLLD